MVPPPPPRGRIHDGPGSRQDCDHLIPGPRLHIPTRAQHPVQRLVCTQSGD